MIRLLSILLLIGCNKNETIQSRGGVVITFDDKNIHNWYSYKYYYLSSNIKGTFFLSHLNEYTNDEINMLIELKDDGHELAYHGTNHINANDYLQSHTLQDYLNYEIYPDLDMFEDMFGYPISFAYPYGVRNDTLDNTLFNYFNIIRATAYSDQAENNSIKNLDKIFFKTDEINSLVFGVGIDSIYQNSINNIKEGINRAYENDEIIIFYLHNIGGNELYHINFEIFDQIIFHINELEMSIYTISQINP